jgi:hypothetical protein
MGRAKSSPATPASNLDYSLDYIRGTFTLRLGDETKEIQLRDIAVPIASLKLDPKNERKHERANIDGLKGALRRFGIRSAISVRARGKLVTKGNGTILALRELAEEKATGLWEGADPEKAYAWDQVPVFMFDDNAKTAAAYRVTDNRTGETSTWHWDKLSETIKELGEDVDWTKLGWESEELDLLAQADWSPEAKGEGGDEGDEEDDGSSTEMKSGGASKPMVLKLEGKAVKAMRKAATDHGLSPMDLLLTWLGVRKAEK